MIQGTLVLAMSTFSPENPPRRFCPPTVGTLLTTHLVIGTLIPLSFEIGTFRIHFCYLLGVASIIAIVCRRLLAGRVLAGMNDPLLIRFWALWCVMLFSAVMNRHSVSQGTISHLVVWTLWVLLFTWIAGDIAERVQIRPDEVEKGARTLCRMYAVVALVGAGVAIVEFIWPEIVHALFNPDASEELWGLRTIHALGVSLGRVGSVLGSPNSFGSLTVLGIILGWERSRTVPRGPLGITLLLAASLGFALSNSRGAAIGLVVAIMYWTITVRVRLIAVCTGCTLLLGAVLAWKYIAAFFEAGYQPTVLTLALPAPLAERLYYWFLAVSLFERHLPGSLLYGIGAFNLEFRELAIAALSAHNVFLTYMTSFGLLGLLIFLWILSDIWSRTGELLGRIRGGGSQGFGITVLLCRVIRVYLLALVAHSLVDDLLLFNTKSMAILLPAVAWLSAASTAGSQAASAERTPFANRGGPTS